MHPSKTGPYDELVLLPGKFSGPQKGQKNLRITRIYVSQADTCYNGEHLSAIALVPLKTLQRKPC